MSDPIALLLKGEYKDAESGTIPDVIVRSVVIEDSLAGIRQRLGRGRRR